MAGYIKLHRQLTEWEWYKNIPVKTLFIHCLLRANHKDNKWQGIVIKKGSFVTSLDNLAFETGLTKRQVRTALDKLKTTHELTHQTTRQYSIIIINNWDKFQFDDTQPDTQMTHERHTDDTQMTLNKNEKNEKNEKNIISFTQEKNLDPFINPIKTFFQEQYTKIMGKTPRLSYIECNRLIELAGANEDIKELIPEAIKRLKRIDFKDIQFTPSASWLLKGNNFERVMNGEFEPKKTEYDRLKEKFCGGG